MARNNRKGEIFSHISKIGVFRDTAGGGSSTATGSLPGVDTQAVLNVVSGTNFANGDWFRVRALDNKPEINQIGSILTNAITPKYRHCRAIAVGDPVVEQTQVDLGHIAVGSPRLMLGGTNTVARSEVRRRSIASLLGSVRWTLEFGLLGHNLENFMVALGMLDTNANVLGAETAADPLRAFINGEKIREQNDLCWFVEGQLKDGTNCHLHLFGCEVDYAALQTRYSRGQTSVLPVRLIPTADVRISQYA